MDGQGTLDLELERLDALSLEEMGRSLDAQAVALGLRDPEPEVWPSPFDHTDWLGLEHLGAGEVVWDYGAPPEGPPLSENVRHKRELLGWVPELPLKEIRVHCAPRTDAPTEPCCDAPHLVRHGPRSREVADRRIHNAPTTLVIEWTRYRCKTCRKLSAAPLPDIHHHHDITRRLHRDIALGSVKRPFADVARLQSVDTSLVERVFHDYQATMLEDYHVDLPKYIGVDETRLSGELCFIATDLTNGRLLDIQKGNSKKSIYNFFNNASYYGWVEVFCLDMHHPYKRVAQHLFPKALIVVDRFHVLQQASFAMDRARKEFAADLIRPHRVMLSRHGRLFTVGATHLRPAQRTLLKDLKAASPRLALAHKLKTDFASIYARPTRAKAEEAFTEWCEALKHRDNRPVVATAFLPSIKPDSASASASVTLPAANAFHRSADTAGSSTRAAASAARRISSTNIVRPSWGRVGRARFHCQYETYRLDGGEPS